MARKYSDYRSGRSGKVGRIRNLSSSNQHKRSIDQQQNCREETTIPEKSLRGGTKSQGHSTESKDDADARGDFLIYPR